MTTTEQKSVQEKNLRILQLEAELLQARDTLQFTVRKELQDSELRFHNLVEKAPSPICIFKGENMILDVANEAVFNILNVGKEALGKPFLEIIPEMKDQPFMGWLLDVFHTGVSHYGNEEPAYLTNKNGQKNLVYFNFVYQPYCENDGTISGVVVLATDITEQVLVRKKIEESEAFSLSVLNISPDCVNILDAKGRLQFMNNSGICLLEIDDFSLVKNKLWSDLWEEQNRQTIKDAVIKAFNGERVQFQVLGKTFKGTPKWWDVIVLPIQRTGQDATVKQLLSVSRDITEQKQQELKEKELLNRFQNLVMQAPVAMCVLRGKDYVIEVINREMYEMWDRTLEESLNKPAFEVLPELMDQGFKELLDKVYTTGERFIANELPIGLKRNGKIENAFVKFVYEPLREADGTISGVMALAHEITEQVVLRKKIEESEAHFRKMTDLMPAKISNANPDGDVIYFNKNWLDFAGMNFDDLKAFGYYQIMHPDEIPEFQQRLQKAFETREQLEMEMRFKNAAGDYIWHLNLASPVKDAEGKIKMWVGVTTEIQKIKQEEERKGDFIKMVSHELKTPVTSIKGYVQILLMMLNEELGKVSLEQIKSSLVRIDKQIVNLTRLIYEMLDLTRLEEGSLQLKMEAFSLNNLIKDITDDIATSQPKYIIELKQDVIAAVFADRGRIEQVLINFINNAIKYSPQSSSIEISIYQPEPDKVSVSVKDFGIGINKEEHQKIFERFYRVGGKIEQTFPGFGIGLFIASSIIQKHNGTISINSEKGKGSEFTFTLNTVPENNL